MIEIASVLTVALLFGGMALFSFGFAAFLFTALPMPQARSTIRAAFPHFYLFVLATAVVLVVMSLTRCSWVPTVTAMPPPLNRPLVFSVLSWRSLRLSLAKILAVSAVLNDAVSIGLLGPSVQVSAGLMQRERRCVALVPYLRLA